MKHFFTSQILTMSVKIFKRNSDFEKRNKQQCLDKEFEIAEMKASIALMIWHQYIQQLLSETVQSTSQK